MNTRTVFSILGTMVLTCLAASTLAQEILIPDGGLDAAIRDALNKPTAPLTQQDLLTLTNLNASHRSIFSLEGLEAGRNLISLDLSSNFLASASIPSTLTKLSTADLSWQFNALRNCSFPDTLTNLSRVLAKNNVLTNITLPNGLVSLLELNLAGNVLTNLSLPLSLRAVGSLGLSMNRLTGAGFLTNLTELNNLDLENNRLSNFTLPSGLTNMFFLSLRQNLLLTNFSLPNGLGRLDTLRVDANGLDKLTLPSGLTRLVELSAAGNPLSDLVLPADVTNLVTLELSFTSLTNLTLPQELRSLVTLDLEFGDMRSLVLSPKLTRLASLIVDGNQLTNLVVPTGLTNLTTLDASFNQLGTLALPPLPKLTLLQLGGNQLTSLELPPGMTNLQQLILPDNQLTNLSLPPDLNALVTLAMSDNQITTLTLPVGLTNLSLLTLAENQLTELTLPLDMTNLGTLLLDGNPLRTLTLSQQLATTNLAAVVASLRNQGVSVIILQTGANNPPVLAAIPNQTIAVGMSLVITNLANDPDSPPQVLTFSLGAGAAANATIYPANGVFNWRTTAAQVGTNIFTVIVTDNGQPPLSAARSFSVVVLPTNTPPTIAITSPINGASFIAPATITIQAAANDSDGSVTNVQFFDGPNSLGNVSSSPYNLSVSLAAGSHTLTAAASDNLGATPTSLPVTVTVTAIPNSPPTVAITSPTDGTFFFDPATITIQAGASDSEGSVTNVQFFDGPNSLGNVSSSPYNLSVTLPVGSHALTAVATDNLGATTTSQAVTVTVTTNSPPAVTAIVISGATKLPDGAFQFAFTNTPGASFTVLTTTNSAVPVDEWTSAGAAVETSPGSYQFTDVTTDSPQRFYSVRSP